MYYLLYQKKGGDLVVIIKTGTLERAEIELNNIRRGLIKNNREKDTGDVGIWKKVK